MRCPFCGNDDTQVKDSRPTDDNSAIRRRRYCPACESRFTTFERVQLRDLTVVKKDGSRSPFDREKLGRSLKIALRKRPVDEDKIERIINGIQRRLERMKVLHHFLRIGLVQRIARGTRQERELQLDSGHLRHRGGPS